MQSKTDQSEKYRQAHLLENFPNLSNKSVKQLAEVFHRAESAKDGILLARIINEVRQREPLFSFSYLKWFVTKLWVV